MAVNYEDDKKTMYLKSIASSLDFISVMLLIFILMMGGCIPNNLEYIKNSLNKIEHASK